MKEKYELAHNFTLASVAKSKHYNLLFVDAFVCLVFKDQFTLPLRSDFINITFQVVIVNNFFYLTRRRSVTTFNILQDVF
jgi:hypothetical protein